MRFFTNERVIRAAAGAVVLSVPTVSTASPCIEPIDLGGLFEWGQVATTAQSNLLPFRMAFDAATGETHAFGMIDVNGQNVVGAWTWDGFEWVARDTSPLTSQFISPPTANVIGLAVDPTTRVAIIIVRTVNALEFAYAFNIDDFSAPLMPLGLIFEPGAAARSRYVAFAIDEGAFYLFNQTSGVLRFDPETGVITPTGAPGGMLPPGLESECVYDLDERRVVIVESIANPPRTWIYSLDANTLVETTDPATAPPPGGQIAHRLVSNSSTGEVFLVAFRLTASAPLATDALYKLDGDADWSIADTFTLSSTLLFVGAPAAVFDERAGQILLAGGWSQTGSVITSDFRNQAIRFESPQFAAPPASITVPEGQAATLVALPSANSLYASVVWRRNGEVLTETGIPALVIANATAADAGVYTAEMVGLCGNTVSQEFTLTVTCPGDSDASGAVNFVDLNAVLSNFGQNCD
ncbi:MAG: immunoglobulin domain-containing protein [Phycisphaerales bacterium]